MATVSQTIIILITSIYFVSSVSGMAVWIFWDAGLQHALKDTFRRACYDSIVRAATNANLPVIVGDDNYADWLVDGIDIDFKIFADLKAKRLAMEEHIKNLPKFKEYQGIFGHQKSDSMSNLMRKEEWAPIEKELKDAGRMRAVAADLWRLTIIYKYGGIYVDFSTYIADPNYFKHIITTELANHRQFYGYKAFRKQIADKNQGPVEYQIWFLAAPPRSTFIAMWKDFAVGKVTTGRDIQGQGYIGLEGEGQPDEEPRFRSDYLALGHHAAASLVKMIGNYQDFANKIKWEPAACTYERKGDGYTDEATANIPREFRSADTRELRNMALAKLTTCCQAGASPKFYKFFGGGKAYGEDWDGDVGLLSCRESTPDNVKECFLKYLHSMNKVDKIPSAVRNYQTFHNYVEQQIMYTSV
eukprot:441967_1